MVCQFRLPSKSYFQCSELTSNTICRTSLQATVKFTPQPLSSADQERLELDWQNLQTRIDDWRTTQRLLMLQIMNHVEMYLDSEPTTTLPEATKLFLPSNFTLSERMMTLPWLQMLNGNSLRVLPSLQMLATAAIRNALGPQGSQAKPRKYHFSLVWPEWALI